MLQIAIILNVLVQLLKTGLSFNFDTKFPLVYSNPNPSNRTNYFGYSVGLLPSGIHIGAPRYKDSSDEERGAVFRCEINGPCRTLPLGQSSSVSGRKDGHWVGGTMDFNVERSNFAVCAFRWFGVQKDNLLMPGRCYWSSVGDVQELSPLENQTEYKSARNLQYYYIFGQAGFSAHISYTTPDPELVLGAPGVLSWTGTVLVYRYNAKIGKFNQPVIANFEKVDKIKQNDLLGYEVTSGYFFGENVHYYAASAPRSHKLFGKVFIFKLDQNSVTIKAQLMGSQLGEYFGAALAAGDINKDGLDDLIIGAPFYGKKMYNEGRVYVLLGGNNQFSKPVIIDGSRPFGQFGTCIMILGDIDMDGYADVAISAPYTSDGGIVFIYRGTSQGLNTNATQTLIGKSIVPNIRGFGASLSKAVDLDHNKFPDMAVGAYLSEQAVILRAKPSVALQLSVEWFPQQLDMSSKSFVIRLCSWYNCPEGISPVVNVNRTIIPDNTFQRVNLPSDYVVRNLTLHKRLQCDNVTLFLNENLQDWRPIQILVRQQFISSEETKPKPIFVNKKTFARDDHFCPECPVVDLLQSKTENKFEIPFKLNCADNKACNAELELEITFRNIGANNQFVVGTEYLQLITTVTNKGEYAYFTKLNVEIPLSVHFLGIPPNCKNVEKVRSQSILCDIETRLEQNQPKVLELTMDMGELNSAMCGTTLDFTIVVVTTSANKNDNTTIIPVRLVCEADLALTGYSDQQSYSYESKNETLLFTQSYQVQKFGQSPINEILIQIKIPTTLKDSNYGGINFLNVDTPEAELDGQLIQCNAKFEYDSENQIGTASNLKIEHEGSEKATIIRRSVNHTGHKIEENEFEFSPDQAFYISCSDKNTDCLVIKCRAWPFKNTREVAVLRIKMIIDFVALKEIWNNKDVIILYTEGNVTIIDPPNFIQTGNQPDLARVSSVFVGHVSKQIAVWIIIVSVIAGLLLLCLLTFGLFQVGFFNRMSKEKLEEMVEGKPMLDEDEQ